jgi:carbon storage regulator
MLVLTRRHGESIVIDGGITVTITSVSHDRVRMGIDAPPEIAILRSELERDSASEKATP